jgi:hypothetical protein
LSDEFHTNLYHGYGTEAELSYISCCKTQVLDARFYNEIQIFGREKMFTVKTRDVFSPQTNNLDIYKSQFSMKNSFHLFPDWFGFHGT